MAGTMATCAGRIAVALALIVSLVGCAPSGGILIRPAPTEQALQETVIRSDGWWVSDRIAIVDLDGMLINDRSEGWLAERDNPVNMFAEKVNKARSDPRVRAVVLRINSPGGGVTASDVIYRQVMRLRRERQVPVVAVIEDVGASGGYYIACAADVIVAHPSSITGSIGVIVQTFSVSETMRKLGVATDIITSGPFKAMANPFKPLDPADRELLQGLVDEFHADFVRVVDAGRPALTTDQVEALADGRVCSGRQALDAGLVDALGTVDNAVDLARQMSGAEKVKVVMYHRPLGYRGTVYASSPIGGGTPMAAPAPEDLLDLTRPRILYLWTGRGQSGVGGR